MSLLQLAAGGAAAPKLYSDDVFSAAVYQGNGSTQNIVNGIDLAGKGGLVWGKCRTVAEVHALYDSNRFDVGTSAFNRLSSDSTSAQVVDASLPSSFNANGFSLRDASNQSGREYISWTFRKAPKFFDVVAYTGNGVAGRTIAHNLGVAPGMIIVKRTNLAQDWRIYHRGATNTYLEFNTAAAQPDNGAVWGDGVTNIPPTASVFSVSANNGVNGNGDTYVAYLFAHDTSTDGLIQCGSFTTDGSGNATVNLGWEPQYLMVKKSSAVVGSNDWCVVDSSRGFVASPGVTSAYLSPNLSAAEASWGGIFEPTATGFRISSMGATSTCVYLAIRRPNKPPTLGTQVYNAIARTGTNNAVTETGVGFSPDLVIPMDRGGNYGATVFSRLTGAGGYLRTVGTGAETVNADSIKSFDMNGVTIGATNIINYAATTFVDQFFKRAPGVMDIVCYTGTGSATTVAHNLGVPPELMIVKCRSSAGTYWVVYHKDLGPTKYLYLNQTSSVDVGTGPWNDTPPTSSVFTLGNGLSTNPASQTQVAYLFATLAGISKCFSFTGNGSGQTINCGFTTGARFILVKASSTTGSWWVYDSTRGIIAAADPALQLNSTAAEVTADCVDPDASGFIVNQEATCSINANGVTYIGLAFA